MSDYGGIGDAMVFLAVIAAFGAPAAVGAIIGLVLAAFGFVTAGLILGCVGLVAGIVCAVLVLGAA